MPWDTSGEYIRSGHKDSSNYDRIRTISVAPGIKALVGFPKGGGGPEITSYLFDKKKFTLEEAKTWFKEHKKKEEFPVKSWVEEIEDAFTAMDELQTMVWQANINYTAGTMIAELIPDFKTPNQNGFFLHKSLKENLMARLNSGKIFLRDSHDRSIKSILGIVTGAHETPNGKIDIEAELDEDPKVDALLKSHKDSMGVSLGGYGVGYCTICGQRVEGMKRCWKHPEASICVKSFVLKEVSLTDDPAWSTSRVKNYS